MSSYRQHSCTKACPCLARSASSLGPSDRRAFSPSERRSSRRYMDGDSAQVRLGSRPAPWPDAPCASHASQRNELLDWKKRNPMRRICSFFYRRPSGLHVDVSCTRTSWFRFRFGRSQGLDELFCRARCLRRGKNTHTLHIQISTTEMWWQQEQGLHTTGWREQRTPRLWLGRSPRKKCKNDVDE